MQSNNNDANSIKKNRKKSNNFLLQGSILAAASIISRIIGLLYRVPLTYLVGDEGMGIYSKAYSIYNMGLIISSYSIPLAVSKLVAIRTSKKEYKNSYRLFTCALTLATVLGLIVSLVLFFGADLITSLLFNTTTVALPLKVLAPTILVFSIVGVLRGFFQGKSTMLPTSISQLLEQVVNAAISLIASSYLMNAYSANKGMGSYGATGATFGTLMGTVVALLFLAFIFSLYKPILVKQMKKDKDENHETREELITALAVTCIPVIIGQAVYQLNGILDTSLYGHIMGNRGIDPNVLESNWGIYSNKYNLLINVPVAIASAMAVAIIPSISSAYAKKNIVEVKNKVHQAIKINMIIAIPAAVGMSVLAGPILQLLFKDTRDVPIQLVRMGSIAIIFYALSTITNAVLQGINRMRIPVKHSLISLAIHVVLVFILLRFTSLDLMAMVIGNITFALVVCILNWISVGKYLRYRQEVVKSFLMPALCSIVMGVVTYFSYEAVHSVIPSNAIATIISIGLSCVVYGVMLLLTKTMTLQELSAIPGGRKILSLLRKIRIVK